ncbi:MAG: YncE family protein [Acidimicrobiia bacterium]|nr:YncE family protein [Acidimicrobiia bacterium]
MQRLLIVVAILVVATGCARADVDSASPTSVVEVEEAAATTSSTMSSTTTTTSVAPPVVSSTTTTTTPTRFVEFSIETMPVSANVTVDTSVGALFVGPTPFSWQLAAGPARAHITADGWNTASVDFEVRDGGELSIWLDREGQLLHKLAEMTTGDAPKQVAFTPDGSELWVTLLAGRGFQVFDPLTGELLADVDLPDAGSVEVIFNRSGDRAFISQMETASVYEVDVRTRQIVRRMSTLSTWTKVMALSPDESVLYASNWLGDDVSEIDLESGETIRRIPTVHTPRGLYVTPDGQHLYVAGFGAGEIEVIDLETGVGTVIYRSGGAIRHLVGDPEAGVIYASDMARARTLRIDVETNVVTELAGVDRTPNTIDLDPDGRVLFVSNRGRNNAETYYRPGPEWGSVVLVDTVTGIVLDAIVGGNQTTGLDVSPDGTMLAFSDFLDDRVSVYSIPSYEVLAAGDGGRWEKHLAEIRK